MFKKEYPSFNFPRIPVLTFPVLTYYISLTTNCNDICIYQMKGWEIDIVVTSWASKPLLCHNHANSRFPAWLFYVLFHSAHDDKRATKIFWCFTVQQN